MKNKVFKKNSLLKITEITLISEKTLETQTIKCDGTDENWDYIRFETIHTSVAPDKMSLKNLLSEFFYSLQGKWVIMDINTKYV